MAVHPTSLSTEPSSTMKQSRDSRAVPLRMGVWVALSFIFVPGESCIVSEGIGRTSRPTICVKWDNDSTIRYKYI